MKYDNLRQNKRKKMLFLVLLLVFYPFINVTGINLTYIVKKDKNVIHPSCIAEELERYAGIGWVFPIPTTPNNIPNITTKFIPTISNEYSCGFSKNSLCNTKWSLRDWKIDESSPKTRDFLPDRRWEDLPTILISNVSKEFTEKFELNQVFKQGFSIRADGLVEILLCNGWNPYDYPCYYFHIDYREIYFKIFETLPKELKDEYKNGTLGNYKAYSNILSPWEWRNFILSSDADGLVKLVDVNLNRTLMEHTVIDPLTPMYMLMRSTNCSLWKIHQNNFLFTNGTHISRLGPQLAITNRDLCVSLFVTTCTNCEMTFFYQNGTVRKVLKQIGPTKNGEWMEIKLKEENIQLEKVNIFVETKFVDNKLYIPGFWAIDDVRVCNENEVRVSFLKMGNISENFSEDDISCQLIRKPSWRPKKLTYDEIKDFPKIAVNTNTNSIKLRWSQEDPTNQISYFISYEANALENDICSTAYDATRMKSNGFVSTKLNEIVLENLVPYTKYNVTVSTILHENDRKLVLQTLEAVELNLEELPFNIQVKALDTSINVSWESVDCSKKYGRLVYTLIVSNNELNFTKEISLQTENSYKIDGLQPFTTYTLQIMTARNGRNIYRNIHTNTYVLNFITMAGVPGKPTNVTYKIVDCQVLTDYCHLNVTWLHPLDQNGTITSFNIILNSTDKRKDSEDDKYIHEVYKVENKTYYHDYTYQIKYLPYSTYYNLYLQSANTMYKSDLTQLMVKTDNIGDHIDQSPKIIAKSDSTLLFKIPRLDRRLEFYTLTIVVQDYDESKKIDSRLLKNKKIAENVCHQYGETWISQVVKVVNSSKIETVIIDSAGKDKLKPETKYCITFIITNQYKGSEHDVIYYEKLRMSAAPPPTTEEPSSSSYSHLYMLLLLLLLIPVAFLIYRYLRKKKVISKPLENNDNVYETLPFDECELNDTDFNNGKVSSFSNKTYD